MFDQLGDEETVKAARHFCHVKFKLVLLYSCFPFPLQQEGIKCCRGNRKTQPGHGWLMIHTGCERSLLETKILICQSMWHVLGGGEHAEF